MPLVRWSLLLEMKTAGSLPPHSIIIYTRSWYGHNYIYGMVQLSLHLFTATCTLCLFCYISGLKVSIPEMSVIHTCT